MILDVDLQTISDRFDDGVWTPTDLAALFAEVTQLRRENAELREEAGALQDRIGDLIDTVALGKKLDDAFTPDTRPLMCPECYGGNHPHGFNGCPLCHCLVRIPAQLVLVGRAS